MTNWSFGEGSHRGFTTAHVGLAAPGSTNTKTAWVELVASLTTGGWFLFSPKIGNTSRQMFDIGIGSAGNEKVLVENIYYEANGTGQNYRIHTVPCPVYIPAGTRVSVRYQATTVSTDAGVYLDMIPVSSWFSGRMLSRGKSFGAVTAGNTIGTAIDPGAVVDTYGSWTNVGSVTTNTVRVIVPCIGRNNNTALSEYHWIVQIGWGVTAARVAEFAVVSNIANNTMTPNVVGPFPVNVPAGEQIKVRAKCSGTDATDRKFDIVLLGFS